MSCASKGMQCQTALKSSGVPHLTRPKRKGWSDAHDAAANGRIFNEHDPQEFEILSQVDNRGHSVAATMATAREDGEVFERFETLSLPSVLGGTVAGTMVMNNGHRFSEETDKDVLLLKDHQGWTVAHADVLSNKRLDFTDPDILGTQTVYGTSVAHVMVQFGEVELPSNVWNIKNEDGDSVAHYATLSGWLPLDADLSLKSDAGLTVADVYLEKKGVDHVTDYVKDVRSRANLPDVSLDDMTLKEMKEAMRETNDDLLKKQLKASLDLVRSLRKKAKRLW